MLDGQRAALSLCRSGRDARDDPIRSAARSDDDEHFARTSLAFSLPLLASMFRPTRRARFEHSRSRVCTLSDARSGRADVGRSLVSRSRASWTVVE